MNESVSTNMAFVGMSMRMNSETRHLHQEQVTTRPEIDDVICHFLEGDTLKDAMIFIDNIRANKMKIRWSSVNVWSVQYKRKHVCDLRIEKGSLVIGAISGVLITHVNNVSRNPEYAKQFINALKSSIPLEQELNFAMS